MISITACNCPNCKARLDDAFLELASRTWLESDTVRIANELASEGFTIADFQRNTNREDCKALPLYVRRSPAYHLSQAQVDALRGAQVQA